MLSALRLVSGMHLVCLQLKTFKMFTLKEHVNTLAPLENGKLWVVLHNLGAVSQGRVACWLMLDGTFPQGSIPYLLQVHGTPRYSRNSLH